MNPNPTQSADRSTERRELARIPLECNALVRLAEYLTFRARLRNISSDAVQIICDPRYALLLHPGGSGTLPDANRLLDISIGLPKKGTAADFKACCRVKYCTRLGPSDMILGLQFVSMDFHSLQQLDTFIEANS